MKRVFVRQSVKAVIKEGVWWSMMSGFVEPYVVPFALAFGAGNIAIAVLKSLPSLVASVFQIFTEKIVGYLNSCKKVVLAAVLMQAVSLFFVFFCPVISGSFKIYYFIAIIVVYTVMGSIAGPPWVTLMGEYIPPGKRGKFFGMRNQLVGITFLIASFLASWILTSSGKNNVYGFIRVFVFAGIFGIISYYYITKVYESPALKHIPQRAVLLSIKEIFGAGYGNMTAFLLSNFVLLFSTYLAAPFFGVYVLNELRYDYFNYMLVMSIGPFTSYLVMKRWGDIADIIGSVKILKIAFLGVPFVPLLWMLSKSVAWLVVFEIFSGIVWAAYIMGINNFMYDYTRSFQRTRYNAYFAAMGSIAQFAGSLLGGYLYNVLPEIGGSRFIMLLLLSGIMRIISIIPFVILVKETRKVRKVSDYEALLLAVGFKSVSVHD